MRRVWRAITAAIGLCGVAGAVLAAERAPESPLKSAPKSLAESPAAAKLARDLAAQERKRGPNSPLLLPVLEQLAQARWRDGALDAAETCRRRALDIAVRGAGGASPSAAEAMTALALAHIERRRWLDAEPLLIAAENILTGRGAPDHPALVAVWAARARVAAARGEADADASWGEKAVAAAAKNPQPRSVEPWRALAAARVGQDRLDEAQALLQDALARLRARRNPDPGELARTLAQLGNLNLRRKKFAAALPLLEEAAALDQARLGPLHPLIADDFADLGLAYDGLKRGEAARKALAFAIGLLQRGSEKNTPRVAYAELELARILREQGKEAESGALFDHARELLNDAEDDDHERERRV